MRLGGSADAAEAHTFKDMNPTRSTQRPSTHHRAARTGLALAGSAVLLVGASAVPAAAAATTSSTSSHIPAKDTVVTCTIGGNPVDLTGTSGTIDMAETTRLDGQGRAHSMFHVEAHQVSLLGPDGSKYWLTGSGYDHVLYPTAQNWGDELSEQLVYHFDVHASSGVIGVVRFSLSYDAGSAPVISDSSTCQLPH
jgi:hypothetical protein